ncbi:MAG TPA: efflux RND transporter periplasmic adaptor subunit [Opitutaceae bacterium]|nr:efflux RND transporter periplasmic adaptor subunit [Opitutaceae bacterium]
MNTSTDFSASHSALFRTKPFSRAWLIRRGTLIALGSIGSVALLGCGRGSAKVTAVAPRVVRVVEIDASSNNGTAATQYTGVVRARTESNLGFRVAGKISERLVNAGDTVKKDQPLLKLDPVDYELALQSARAAVEAARAINTQARLEQERVRILVAKGADSRDALEKIDAAAESSGAQLRSAESQANQIANQTSYTTLVSDSDGIVMTTLAEPGQVVSAGQTVIVLARDGSREAAVDIPEGSLEDIRNHTATARLYLNQAVTVPATLREVSGVADPIARTFQARYVLEGDQTQFPLGSTVTVLVSEGGKSIHPNAEIPLGSLIDRGDGAAVWVVDSRTSAVQKRAVSIAKLGAETAIIKEGLRPGDLVVSLGAQLLNSGEVVRVAKSAVKEAK